MNHNRQPSAQEASASLEVNKSVDGSKTFPTFRATARLWKRSRRFVLGLTLLAVAAHTIFHIYATVQLNRALADLRASGQPLNLAEMAPLPVPDSDNAAVDYMRADKVLAPSRSWEQRLFEYSRESVPPQELQLQQLLQPNQEVVELARQGAAKSACVFAVDWNQPPPNILFSYYQPLRRLAILLQFQAVHEARSGNLSQALRDVRNIFQMSHHLSNEPIILGVHVSRSLESFGYRALGQVLEEAKITPTDAAAIRAVLPSNTWPAAVRRAFQGERIYGLWLFESIRSGSDTMQLWPSVSRTEPGLLRRLWWRVWNVVWMPCFKLDEVEYIHYFDRIIANVNPAPFTKSSAAPATGDEEFPWYARVTKTLYPVFGGLNVTDEAEVKHRQAEVALRLALYRARHGSYPQTLAELKDASIGSTPVPVDPYSQRDFVYRRDGQNYLLYSVGTNGRDDGGRNRQRPEKDDLVWPAQRR